MSDRTWVPTAYLDEISPPGRETPSAWIAGHGVGDVFKLAPPWEHGDTSGMDVRLGETIGFHCTDDYGEIDVTIRPDGTFERRGDVPREATHFWLAGDADSLASTLEDFVRQYVESAADGEEHTETVRMAWWSDDLPHMLVVNDGKPHFAMVAAARAQQ